MQPDLLALCPFSDMALTHTLTQGLLPSPSRVPGIAVAHCSACMWEQEEVSGSPGSIFVVNLCPMCLMEMLFRRDLAWARGELTPVV